MQRFVASSHKYSSRGSLQKPAICELLQFAGCSAAWCSPAHLMQPMLGQGCRRRPRALLQSESSSASQRKPGPHSSATHSSHSGPSGMYSLQQLSQVLRQRVQLLL
jgi:hypothetical protein